MSEQLDLFGEPAVQDQLVGHIPTLGRGYDGTWRVYCVACSAQVADYVPQCRRTDPKDWPPLVLTEPVSPPRRRRGRPRGDVPDVAVSADARDTSRAAAAAVEPRARSRQADVLTRIRSAGNSGLTDWELECLTKLTHQSVSAARNTLMNRGLVEDSGKRRKTQTGNQAIAWRAVARPLP